MMCLVYFWTEFESRLASNFFLYIHHLCIYSIIRRLSLHHTIHYNAMHPLFLPLHSFILLHSSFLFSCLWLWRRRQLASTLSALCECVTVWVSMNLCPHVCVYISLAHTPTHTHTHALSLFHPSIYTSLCSLPTHRETQNTHIHRYTHTHTIHNLSPSHTIQCTRQMHPQHWETGRERETETDRQRVRRERDTAYLFMHHFSHITWTSLHHCLFPSLSFLLIHHTLSSSTSSISLGMHADEHSSTDQAQLRLWMREREREIDR